MHNERRVEKLLDIEVNAIKKRNKIQQAKRFKKQEQSAKNDMMRYYLEEAAERNKKC